MYLPDVQLHEARTLDEATTLLSRFSPDARLLAGGTDLLVDLKTGRVQSSHMVSIRAVAELRGVSMCDGTLRIGALTTVTELDQSPILADGFNALRDATSRMAAPQVRNAATVGGNIAGAVPCADLPPILMIMRASVLVWSPTGERMVALEDFFVGPRETVLREGEILTAIFVPVPPTGFGAAYSRFSLREGNAIAVAGVAAGLEFDDENRVITAGIALASVAPIPKLAETAGDSLVGSVLDEEAVNSAAKAAMEAAEPISDIRGSAAYRRQVVGVLTKRALFGARDRARS